MKASNKVLQVSSLTAPVAATLLAAVCTTVSAQAPEAGGADGTSVASDEATERARSLFAEGVSLTDARRWPLAATRFREALALKDAQPIRYNLASTLIELGEFQEADELLHEVLADDTSSEALRRSATQARGDVRARAAELRFTEPQVTRVNGQFLPRDFVDKALFVAPGEHIIEYVRGGRVREQRVVQLEAASITTVRWGQAVWEARRNLHEAPEETSAAESETAVSLTPIPFSPLQPSADAAESAPVASILAVGFTVALVVTVGVVAAVTSDGAPIEGATNPQFEGPTGVEILSF